MAVIARQLGLDKHFTGRNSRNFIGFNGWAIGFDHLFQGGCNQRRMRACQLECDYRDGNSCGWRNGFAGIAIYLYHIV